MLTPIQKFFLICTCFVSIISCESKVNEGSADGFAGVNTADYKAKVQRELDKKIEQLQLYVTSTKQVIANIQSIIKVEELKILSIFDVIEQINEKAQNDIIKFKNQNLFEEGEFMVKTPLLNEPCQNFSYQLVSESIEPISEINYSLKSCYYNSEYLNVITAKYSETQVEVSFNDQNLKKILPPEVIESKISNCTFSKDPSVPTTCKDIMFAQSADLVWFMDIVSQAETQVSIHGISKKTGNLVYDWKALISKDGKVQFVNKGEPLVSQ